MLQVNFVRFFHARSLNLLFFKKSSLHALMQHTKYSCSLDWSGKKEKVPIWFSLTLEKCPCEIIYSFDVLLRFSYYFEIDHFSVFRVFNTKVRKRKQNASLLSQKTNTTASFRLRKMHGKHLDWHVNLPRKILIRFATWKKIVGAGKVIEKILITLARDLIRS